jgi:hypothetical protein
MFISFLYTFRATVCPSSGEIAVSMRHLVFVTLSGTQGGFPPCVPDSRPYRITSTKRRMNTVVSPDDGHTVARNVYRKEINILRKTVHQFGFIYNFVNCVFFSPEKKHIDTVITKDKSILFAQ